MKEPKRGIRMSFTERGFIVGYFNDLYGAECSIQESSLADKPAIWLGVNGPEIFGAWKTNLGYFEDLPESERLELIAKAMIRGWCGHPDECVLGYNLEHRRGPYDIHIGYPAEPCPKPKTNMELVNAPRKSI